MVVLSKPPKLDNFESHKSLKVSFTNILGFCLTFVGCESFLGSNSPDILALSVTKLDDPIDYRNFFVTGFVHLI